MRIGLRTAGRGLPLLLLLIAFPLAAAAQDTRVVVISGVGGDPTYTAQFHKWADQLVDAMKTAGMPDADITYLAEMPEKDAAHKPILSNKENVTKALTDVAAKGKPGDEVFVLLIGHGSMEGPNAMFNIPGPDISAADFAVLLDRFKDQRVVFVDTTSASGPFIEPLKKSGRVVITATNPRAGEREDTRFPEYFIQALTTTDADGDHNGRVSVGEAFQFATQKVKDEYAKKGTILDEHAVLEDGNEGKLAATIYVAPDKSASQIASTADPELRALLQQQADLNRQIDALRVKKDSMDPAEYEKQLEKLVTDLALKSRVIRDREGKK